MNVVLDTNVIIAAFAARGLCESVLAVCLDQHQISASDYILDEVADKLSGKLKLPAVRVREILKFLREHSTIVVPTEVPSNACRDADDLAILGTLVAASADCLITGDADLLALGTFAAIPIYSPRQFYEQLP